MACAGPGQQALLSMKNAKLWERHNSRLSWLASLRSDVIKVFVLNTRYILAISRAVFATFGM